MAALPYSGELLPTRIGLLLTRGKFPGTREQINSPGAGPLIRNVRTNANWKSPEKKPGLLRLWGRFLSELSPTILGKVAQI